MFKPGGDMLPEPLRFMCVQALVWQQRGVGIGDMIEPVMQGMYKRWGDDFLWVCSSPGLANIFRDTAIRRQDQGSLRQSGVQMSDAVPVHVRDVIPSVTAIIALA